MMWVFCSFVCLVFAQNAIGMLHTAGLDFSKSENVSVNDGDLFLHITYTNHDKQVQKAYRELSDAKMDLVRFNGYFNTLYGTQPEGLSEPELQDWKASKEKAVSDHNALLIKLEEAKMSVAAINSDQNNQ